MKNISQEARQWFFSMAITAAFALSCWKAGEWTLKVINNIDMEAKYE